MPRIRQYKNEYIKKDFSKWLFFARKDMGITQSDMAEKLNVTQQRYGQKEKKADFKLGELLIIFDTLETSKEELERVLGFR